MANSLRKLCENKDKLQNISVKDFMTLFEENDIIPSKSPSPHVYFAREITKYRALIYSLVCGVQQPQDVNELVIKFLAGCNRYGIDNPCPIISKRLSLYGVPEEIEKDFKKLLEKYQKLEPRIDFDPNCHGPAELKM